MHYSRCIQCKMVSSMIESVCVFVKGRHFNFTNYSLTCSHSQLLGCMSFGIKNIMEKKDVSDQINQEHHKGWFIQVICAHWSSNSMSQDKAQLSYVASQLLLTAVTDWPLTDCRSNLTQPQFQQHNSSHKLLV